MYIVSDPGRYQTVVPSWRVAVARHFKEPAMSASRYDSFICVCIAIGQNWKTEVTGHMSRITEIRAGD
jgi:hypothetical protein